MSHKIHNLFPIPIFTTKLPSKYSKITNFFNNQEMSRHSHEYGTFSDNDYILNSSECKEIKKYILTLVNEYGYNVLKYDYKNKTIIILFICRPILHQSFILSPHCQLTEVHSQRHNQRVLLLVYLPCSLRLP